MGEFKERKAISEWIKFELDTKELDPPVIELRLSPIESITAVDGFDQDGGVRPFSEIMLGIAMDCVQEWDVKQKGKLLPIEDPQIKKAVLKRLLGEKLKGKTKFLGTAIAEYAKDLDNFVKN